MTSRRAVHLEDGSHPGRTCCSIGGDTTNDAFYTTCGTCLNTFQAQWRLGGRAWPPPGRPSEWHLLREQLKAER